MARRSNYSYEKRQRELKRKQSAEEKRNRRQSRVVSDMDAPGPEDSATSDPAGDRGSSPTKAADDEPRAGSPD